MADDTVLPGTGDTIAADDIGGVKYQRVKLIHGANGVNSGDVEHSNPFPVSVDASNFVFSTVNTSSTELAASATFSGAIESTLNQPSISILLTSDQPITLTVYQYIDVAGTYAVPPIVYYVKANAGLSASFPINGNYVRVSAQNTGSVITTTFELNVAYGSIESSDGSGRLPISKADCIPLLSSTISAAGVSGTMDTLGYGAVVAQLSGTWQGVCYFEASNDGLAWDSVLVFSRDNLSLQDIVTSCGLYTVRPSGRYLRLNVTSITGSMTVSALGRAAEGIAASDLLSLAMDRSNNTPLQVQLQGHKVDGQGALIPSDAAGPYYAVASAASGTIGLVTVDTTGYQSVTVGGISGAAAIQGYFSDTGAAGTWTQAGCLSCLSGANIPSQPANNVSFSSATPAIAQFPVIGRYFQVRFTTVSTAPAVASVMLRQTPVVPFGNVGLASGRVQASVSELGSMSLTAEDAAATTVPMIVGGITRTGLIPATIVNGDAQRATFSTSGQLVVERHAVPELTWVYAAPASGLVNTTTAVTIKAAVAAQRGNISSIQIMSEALGTATEFAIRDGAAGTVLWRIKINTAGLVNGQTFVFDPPLRQAAVNTLLEIVTLTASTTGAVYFNAQGFMSN